MHNVRAEHPFHLLIKPIGPLCNLDCEYCFYLEKEQMFGDKHSFRMTQATLERLTQQYIEAQPAGAQEVNFAWQGGEPTLMGVAFFQQAIDLQRRFGREGMRITNSIQTNGTLLNDEWGAFLKENDFLVGISIDGPEDLHDHYRKTKKGEGSFQQVLAGLGILQKFGIDYNVLCVINRVNAEHPLEVYGALKALGAEHIQFIPIVEYSADPAPRLIPQTIPEQAVPVSLTFQIDAADIPKVPGAAGVSDRSVLPAQFGDFLLAIFNEWRQADIGRVFVQQFENLLATLMGRGPGICVHAPVCGRSLVLEHDGGLYSCDHFVDPQYSLGNISQHALADMVESPQQRKFGTDKFTTLNSECKSCPYLKLCYGGCPAHRLPRVSPKGDTSADASAQTHNYLCEGYKRFFGQASRPLISLIAR